VAEREARRRPELWVLAAWSLGLGELALVVYLGSRPGGRGPIAAYLFGPPLLGAASLLTFLAGTILCFLRRPFVTRPRLAAFVVLGTVVGTVSFPFPFPSSHEGHPSRVEYHLPVRGEWTVAWGGEDAARNLLARSRPDRRWGLDLLRTVDGRERAPGSDGDGLADYLAFDQPVLAPADGVVVAAEDGMSDHLPGEWGAPGERDELGNRLVIETVPGEFLFLANLRQGSLAVAVGDAVERGQELARVGNSGLSRFTAGPHLALHLQDTPEPLWGQAIPWVLRGWKANGEPRGPGLPRGDGATADGVYTGERVESLDP
jgi:hypothetical protein